MKSKKAKNEKFNTRFAKVYTQTDVALAVLLLNVQMIILPNQNKYSKYQKELSSIRPTALFSLLILS